MSDKDLAVKAVGTMDNITGAIFASNISGTPINKKPCYLISLTSTGIKGNPRHFIAFDKPDLLDNFVQVKGIFSMDTEETILSTFNSIMKAAPKETMIDIMFPVHRITSIRSLIFNANKQALITK